MRATNEERSSWPPEAKLLVFRVDGGGNISAGNAAAEGQMANSSARFCHQLVDARTLSGEAVCRPGCTWRLGAGAAPGHERLPVLSGGKLAQLTCQRVGNGAVVVVEPIRPVATPRNAEGEYLTQRELRLLRYLARGDSLADLAMLLGVRASTMRTQVRDLCLRLGARSRAQAVGIAVSHGYLKSQASGTEPKLW